MAVLYLDNEPTITLAIVPMEHPAQLKSSLYNSS